MCFSPESHSIGSIGSIYSLSIPALRCDFRQYDRTQLQSAPGDRPFAQLPLTLWRILLTGSHHVRYSSQWRWRYETNNHHDTQNVDSIISYDVRYVAHSSAWAKSFALFPPVVFIYSSMVRIYTNFKTFRNYRNYPLNEFSISIAIQSTNAFVLLSIEFLVLQPISVL